MGKKSKNWMLTDAEYRILRKYEKPREIDIADKPLVYKLVLDQLMRLGFTEKPNHTLGETVEPTPQGRSALIREKRARQGKSELLYAIAANIS
ncbi:MAG: hypothetical protein K9K66_15810 [Desulfarculaceae bacterium]|nr:hypothetical protein [Desulfarculaceae bacterium]MCF8073648.1 hypothetical protein [Desulfarculaceae bacterium]MCF8103120.1 hypothetical protein [Desulfarculaceae bacterium]MCF8115636.1 hypothetical protein [Desulfarculaceae bacterium]